MNQVFSIFFANNWTASVILSHTRQISLLWPVNHISKSSLAKNTYHMCDHMCESGIVLGVVHRQKAKRPLQGSSLCNLDEI